MVNLKSIDVAEYCSGAGSQSSPKNETSHYITNLWGYKSFLEESSFEEIL